jgi:hypothetical protein
MMTTNGIAPHYAVPELPDAHRLTIVQEQIQQLVIELYKFEAATRALSIGDAQLPVMAANVKRTREILAGYRAIEGELIEKLNGGK